MRTLRLRVEYDGTAYSGWQRQAGVPTIQSTLERAVEAMTRHPTRIRGASRTDAGVHARGQVAAFDTEGTIPAESFERGLNRYLPDDIVVRDVAEVPAGWDPRRTSRGKRYRYAFWSDRRPSALERHRAWFVRGELDLAAMRAAAPPLVGTHDFSSFRAAGCVAKHPVRTLYSLELRPGPEHLVFLDVVGNAFLRNMVRILAGTLAEVGLGRRTSVQRALDAQDRAAAGITAPPEGLYLEEVIYDDRLPPRPADGQDLDDEPG